MVNAPTTSGMSAFSSRKASPVLFHAPLGSNSCVYSSSKLDSPNKSMNFTEMIDIPRCLVRMINVHMPQTQFKILRQQGDLMLQYVVIYRVFKAVF